MATRHNLMCVGIVLAAALCAPSTPALAQSLPHTPTVKSITTSHAYETCRQASSPEPGVIDVRVCKGPADIAITWYADPDNSIVGFGRFPLEESLDIGPFFAAQSLIEWRGMETGKGLVPAAAIVRYSAGQRVGLLTDFRLVVYSLEPGGASCVIAVLDANAGNYH